MAATKYKIDKLETTGVILALDPVNGALAGQRIADVDCEKLLRETYSSIKARLAPSPYQGSPYDKDKD